MSTEAALTPPRLPRPRQRSRVLRILGIGAAVLVLAAWLAWYLVAPDELPTTDEAASVSGVAGTPVYVGVFTAPADFERALDVSGVKVHTEASADMTVTPLLCAGASIDVTTGPERFCDELANPEGRTLGPGDSIILRIEAEAAVEARIQRIEIAYRQGLRWSTEPAGIDGVDVTIAGR